MQDARTVPCPECGAEGALRLGAGTEVEVGTVAVALERRPLVACPAAHDRSPTTAVAGGRGAVAEQLPRARQPRLRAARCTDCGDRLELPVRRTRRTVTVVVADLPVHTLHLDVPMTRCGNCALDQVPGRSHGDIDAAVEAVYAPKQVSSP